MTRFDNCSQLRYQSMVLDGGHRIVQQCEQIRKIKNVDASSGKYSEMGTGTPDVRGGVVIAMT